MNEYKSLADIAWNVDESTYRADSALSYSTLAKYERGSGFDSLPTLFDRIETASLSKGSALDCYLTDGEDEYYNTYYIDDIPILDQKVESTIKSLFDLNSAKCNSMESIPDIVLAAYVENAGLYGNCSRTETRAKKLREAGSQYYRALYLAEGKTIISNKIHCWVLQAAEALRTSPATKMFFEPDNPFEPHIQKYYQLKFKSTINNVDYRCMFDCLYINFEKKFIIPVDLKSSSKKEHNFFKSFIEWRYDIQAKLYSAILRDNLDKDEYFKDFKIMPWQLVVANNQGGFVMPLCWQFDLNNTTDGWTYGKNKTYLRGPLEIGEELKYYLDNQCLVPKDIYLDRPNNLIEHLNNL